MNNQKKNSDVWLIYKCIECDSTFNVTILSRTKPHLIDKDLYEKFINNDFDTALAFSLDQEIINKNHIQIDYDSIEYEIRVDEDFLLEDMIFVEEDIIQIKLVYPMNLNLKLSRILREKLGVSLSRLEKMMEEGVIDIAPFGSLKKDKIKDSIIIRINHHLLSSFLKQ